MCGVFGISIHPDKVVDALALQQDAKTLLRLSSVRGRGSAGIGIQQDQKIYLYKRFLNPKNFIKDKTFNSFLATRFSKNSLLKRPISILGQCRLATSGSLVEYENNQPVHCGSFVGTHNGIVTHFDGDATHLNEDIGSNDSKKLYQELHSEYLSCKSVEISLCRLSKRIQGHYNLAFFNENQSQVYLATNNGSLYYFQSENDRLFGFASEKEILKKYIARSKILKSKKRFEVRQLPAGQALCFDPINFRLKLFTLSEKTALSIGSSENLRQWKSTQHLLFRPDKLNRCSQCVLPETYPFIHFDEKGVCNFCRDYRKQEVHGEEALQAELEKYRSKDGRPDCLVGLSGGRDSCYGLYLLKEKYKMNPVAYTFDWGLTTDISRRNQALVCGKLGIEHILRAPDVLQKRRFVRKNVEAWFRKPHLGMVPLFQAGDKEFYLYGRKLRQELNIDLTVLCSGYQLEQREFMIGFAGVDQPPVRDNHDFYYHPTSTKAKLAASYIYQFMRNPAYLNESLYESLRSFILSFLQKANFLYLYHYLPWNEKQIEDCLTQEFGWEVDQRFGKNQWRMGDGQTAFNNYIYHHVAGFTEFDAFRSNQIREGLISREQAIGLLAEDNRPKFESIQYFCQTIGLSFEETMGKIEKIPRYYEADFYELTTELPRFINKSRECSPTLNASLDL